MPELIAPKKQKWVKRFKPNVLRGAPLNPNVSAQARYYSKMRKLILRMTQETHRQLERLFNKDFAQEHFGEDASIASQARILTNALTAKFDEMFSLHAKSLSESVVDEAAETSATSLRMSLKDLSGGLTLKTNIFTEELNEVLSASITENINLIKSIPAQYMQGVQGAAMRAITNGGGMSDLVKYLQNETGVTLRRARIISEDQSRKAYNNINKIRMQKLGIKRFQWLHSAGSLKPRPLHLAYNGKIFDFDNLPVIEEKTGERGIPGQAINCKCRMIPCVVFDEGN